MLITLIAGARPNFMKIAPLIKAIQAAHATGKDIHYRLVHTGQHYDKNMSDTFFEELGIPMPDVNLGCGGGTQAEQTANIMVAFEQDLMQNPTDIVLVVGDVTSTMACSIVAKKLNTKVCHVEAGIRSWDLTMPEEINRMVTDALADYMFTTSEIANKNLVLQGACLEKPILNPSLKGRTLNTTELSPFPSGEEWGEACSFAQVWGAHTADSTQYSLLKENAKANRKNPTEAESAMWDILKGNNIGYHFRRQHIILDYIVDFICLEKGLVIELDGGYHNDPEQKEYDERRTVHLQRLGYTELRFKNEELLCNPDSVIQKITETLEQLPSLQGRGRDRLTPLPFREGQGVGSHYIQILNSGDILAAHDVTERMFQAMGYGQWAIDNETNRQSPIANRSQIPIFYGNMIKVNAQGKVVGKSGYTEYSLRQFYSSTLNHDCAYIRKDLFEEYGLYDESLKIVSDWKWYLQAIGLGRVKPEYVDIDVTIFDDGGISETNLALRNAERRKVLEEVLPPAVLWDYDTHAFEMEQIKRLRRWHLYGLVYFMERVCFKLEKWFRR